MGLENASALQVAMTIAIFSAGFTWVGMGLGAGSRRHWEQYSEIAAGMLLIGLGVGSACGVL